MRKTIAVAATTGALLFGGAGVAHATISTVPAPASTTTQAAPDNDNDKKSDDTGLWGLAGLLGLGGLAGLMRRNKDPYRAGTPGTTGTGTVRP